MVDLTCQHKNQTLLVEGPEIMIIPVGARQWSMRDRFSAEDLQAMVDLYSSGATAKQVAETFGIGLTSVKRVLRDHGTRKRTLATVVTRHGNEKP
jgi:transposase-like protein